MTSTVGTGEQTALSATPSSLKSGQQYLFARSSRDLVRLVAGLILLALGMLLGIVFADAVVGFEEDLFQAVSRIPTGLSVVLFGTIAVLGASIGLALLVWLLWRRQWRLLGRFLLADLLAGLLLAMVDAAIRRAPDPTIDANPPDWASSISVALEPSDLAVFIATYFVARPLITGPYRRVIFWVIALTAFHVAILGAEYPRNVVAAIACGFVASSIVLLALGRPIRPLDTATIVAGLKLTRTNVIELHPAAVDARGSTPYFGVSDDGTQIFVKVLGKEERSSDVLFRFYRFLRFRGLGDEAIASSLKQSIEHEAMVSALAAADGIRTPRLLGVAEVDAERLALAFERIPGRSLDEVPTEELTDPILREIWRLVAELHARGIAHRDLRLANVFLDDDGRAWIIDFGFGTVAAHPEQMASDVAELLFSMAVAVGAQRSVDAAVSEMPSSSISAALPRLQPDALSTATRKALKAQKGLDKEVQAGASATVGVEKIELQQLERIKPRNVITLVATALAAYFLINQITQIDDLPAVLAGADWSWAGLALVGSSLTYVGAAINLLGGFRERLSVLMTTAVQLAGSFVNRITPVKIGGMAVNVRYLQKQGIDPAAAIAGVGLTQIIGATMHITLAAVFVVWAGTDTSIVDLPSSSTVLIVLLVVVSVVGLVIILRPVRRMIRTTILPATARAASSVRDALRDPGRLAMAFSGSLILNLAYIAAFYASVRAFDYPISVASAGVVYLVGTALASAAPTPGGVGAVEAALIAGLTAVGVPTEAAVPAVLVYRGFTFWLPVLPGWVSFTLLTRREVI